MLFSIELFYLTSALKRPFGDIAASMTSRPRSNEALIPICAIFRCLPRRLLRPLAKRSNTRIACSTSSRSAFDSFLHLRDVRRFPNRTLATNQLLYTVADSRTIQERIPRTERKSAVHASAGSRVDLAPNVMGPFDLLRKRIRQMEPWSIYRK